MALMKGFVVLNNCKQVEISREIIPPLKLSFTFRTNIMRLMLSGSDHHASVIRNGPRRNVIAYKNIKVFICLIQL